jgi:hypothetical protein
MQRTRFVIALAAVGFVLLSTLAPVESRRQTLTPTALDEALRIARTRRPAEFERFTDPYVVIRGGPGRPTVEVITEFRRAVILARQQVDHGNYTWSPTNLSRALAKYEGLSSVRAEIWLSPVHMYVGTPAYRLDLYTAAHRALMATEEKRDPILAPTTPDGSSSMTGVTLESIYRDEALREPGCCLLIIVDPKGETVVKTQVEFANLK